MSGVHVSEIDHQLNQYFNSQHVQSLADKSVKLYRGVARTKLIPFCRLKGISKMDKSFIDHMDEYAQYIRDKGSSALTTQEYLTVTKQFFHFFGYDIKHTYRIPRADKQAWDLKQEQRWFSEDEVALCRTYDFRVNHTRNHLLVRLFSETGARINEVANIRVGDINIDYRSLLLHHSKTVPRSVKINAETTFYIKRHLKRIFAGCHADPAANIFPKSNQIYKIIIEMLKSLELKEKGDGRGPHTFRHYVATYMRYVLRLDLDYVSKVLGDTSEMVTTRYIHPTPEMLHNLVGRAL